MIDLCPQIIPAGWTIFELHDTRMIYRDTASHLRAVFSVEPYTETDEDCPPMGPGTYRRVSLSRKTYYPTWDEMRDFIRECWLFDNTRDIVMILPPDKNYVNLHPNCFHWFQKET